MIVDQGGSMADKLDIEKLIIDLLVRPIAESYQRVSEATASKRQVLSGEDFDGWLPVTINSKYFYDFTLSELKEVRDVSRNLSISSELYKNCLLHYRNYIIGDGIQISIYKEDLGEDPVKLADALDGDSTVKKMRDNWKLFCRKNRMHLRLLDWINRRKRDGEVFIRLFNTPDAPTVRFIDPNFISSDKTGVDYGIEFDKKDLETVKRYWIQNPDDSTYKSVAEEDIIHDKDGVDIDAPRGFPIGYPVFTNIRRVDKLMVNVAILAQIQSAIALIRKHKGTGQAKVNTFLNRSATGTRTNTAGVSVRTRQLDPGTILDAPDTIEYDFPAHKIDAANLTKIAEQDLALIAACFVLPVDWLLSKEPAEPLPPSSPVIANFKTEQKAMYASYLELFWRVQERMGINRETVEQEYNVSVIGPRLAVAKALDEARIAEINVRTGATSPQEEASKIGNNWAISRANVIRHRRTAQPGEQMPGDSGNTNTGGGDGLSKSGGGQRSSDAAGGNNNV